MKTSISVIQNSGKTPSQFKIPRNHIELYKKIKSKVPVDDINVNALLLMIRISFGSMRRDVNLLPFIFRTNFPIRRLD